LGPAGVLALAGHSTSGLAADTTAGLARTRAGHRAGTAERSAGSGRRLRRESVDAGRVPATRDLVFTRLAPRL